MMQYEEALSYIHSLERFGVKPGMERISALCRAFGDVQNTMHFVHVAGTNGKGSTSTMLAGICKSAGLRTGLFISPYVLDFRERIQVDGEMIPKEDLAEIIEKIKPVADEMRRNSESPTEFEVITAAAFLYYAKMQCDIVVLETGLGGRLDSTNIIPCPEVSVITSVSYDHTAILGDTLEKIATEKSGIMKTGGTTVTYPFQKAEVLRVLEDTAKQRNNRLIVAPFDADGVCKQSIYGTETEIDGVSLSIPMLGIHMVYNASMVVAAAKVLREKGYPITDAHIREGISNSRMPARMQVISENPLTIIDGGHNWDCALALRKAVQDFLADKRILMICGMMADKDVERYLETVAPLADTLVAVQPNNPRAMNPGELSEIASRFCKNTFAASSIPEAAKYCKQNAGTDDVILVCGSFYMVSDVEDALKNLNA